MNRYLIQTGPKCLGTKITIYLDILDQGSSANHYSFDRHFYNVSDLQFP